MHKKITLLLLLIFSLSTITLTLKAQENECPKIGLTLSGGGAKGVAHIGVLKAIDSAGLKIDYITGTSMGAIIGGLYAIGYSGNELEKVVMEIDWDDILNNQQNLRDIIFEEKGEFDKYAVELPIVNKKIKFSTGVLDSQELWFTLAKYFYPVIEEKDFTKFPIPFKCISTNVATGEHVVLDSGNIVMAVRASMSLPSVFEAVEYNGVKMIDGGISRNFPVSDAINMGANYTIGINVGQALLPEDEINTPLDVLYQISAYQEAKDFDYQKTLCDIYIRPDVTGYSTGDFSKTSKILVKGEETGDQYYPIFKRLADSLNNIYQEQHTKVKIDPHYSIRIDTVQINGTKKSLKMLAEKRLDINYGEYYTAEQLDKKMKLLYGSRSYRKVKYTIDSINSTDTCIVNSLNVELKETYPINLKAALNYNTYNNLSAIIDVTLRDFLFKNSRSLLTLGLGSNFMLNSEFFTYIGADRKHSINYKIKYLNYNLLDYYNFEKIQDYRCRNAEFDVYLMYNTNRSMTLMYGTKYNILTEANVYSMSDFGKIKQKNNLFSIYGGYAVNTTNKKYFPTEGINTALSVAYIPVQTYSANNSDLEESVISGLGQYGSLNFFFARYRKLSKRSTLIYNVQAGVLLNDENAHYMNDFQVGGFPTNMYNQIVFYGLTPGGIIASSVGTGLIEYQYEPYKNLFVSGCVNLGYIDFFSNVYTGSNLKINDKFLTGGAIKAGYMSKFGPLQTALSYSGDTKKLLFYINLGYQF